MEGGFTSTFILTLLLLASESCGQAIAVSKEANRQVSVRGGCPTANSHGICGPDGNLRCKEGWTGQLCDTALCKAGCDHGSCTEPGECVCELGWRGPLCSECVPLPGCQHGGCNETSFQCHCHQGWGGPHCSHAQCRQSCHPTRGYCDVPEECKCRTGWGGATCEQCAVVPGCQNGYCQKPLECRCFPGWSGHLCQNPICAQGCHHTQGSCSQPGECRCQVGYTGATCSACYPYPGCQHGHCTDPWECNCEAGWTGMLCNQRIEPIAGYCDLNSNACLNGGTCIDVHGPRNYTCSCPSLFTGKRCDYLADRRPRPSFFQSAFVPFNPTTPKTATRQTSLPTTTLTKSNVTTARTPKATSSQTRSEPLSQLLDNEEDDPVVDYDETPSGQHSRIHAVTASPLKVKQQKRQRLLDAKNARRLFLQKQATITFRQSKILPTIRTRSRPLKLPFTVFDRKHLSLPVFLPRVSDILRKNITKSQFFEKNGYNKVDLTTELPKEENKTKIDDEYSSLLSEEIGDDINNENNSSHDDKKVRIKVSYSDSSDFRDDVISKMLDVSADTKQGDDQDMDHHTTWKNSDAVDKVTDEPTIKDLLEEYERPTPVLVVDYGNRQAKNFNGIQKSTNNQIDHNHNYIAENRRFLQPHTLNIASESSKENISSGPSRPMFLVAVRPLPSPNGRIRVLSSGDSIISHGSYPTATFIQESRSGKFIPQGRSAGSIRGPIQFSSPSFSVSQPHSYTLRHFVPQTRLSRRIGHNSSPPYVQPLTREAPIAQVSDALPAASHDERIHFYQEHLDGIVHIGVDRHTPQEEIITAFIEIKKSLS